MNDDDRATVEAILAAGDTNVTHYTAAVDGFAEYGYMGEELYKVARDYVKLDRQRKREGRAP